MLGHGMNVVLLFFLMLLAACAYAGFAGGRDGQWVSCMFVAAALLSVPASNLDVSARHLQLPVFAIDLLLFAGLFAVSLKTASFWPLWVTGFHGVTVSTHIATLFAGNWRPMAYFSMQTFWSLPELIVMVIGVMLDRSAAARRMAAADARNL